MKGELDTKLVELRRLQSDVGKAAAELADSHMKMNRAFKHLIAQVLSPGNEQCFTLDFRQTCNEHAKYWYPTLYNPDL